MAWSVKEDEMKYLWLLISLSLVFAQETSKGAFIIEQDESEIGQVGCVLAIHGDSINFEEAWKPITPEGVMVTTKNNEQMKYSDLQAPFWAKIHKTSKGGKVFVSAIQVLAQFSYDDEGYIIGEYEE